MEDNLKKAIEQMKRGEEKGFNAVYSATYNRVYFRAKQIMKKEEDAQDLTQIVFAEAYKNIHTLQAEEALYSWIDGITYNQGMKIYRKQKDVLLTEEAEGMFEEIESNDISSMPELTADQKATADIIKGIIEELPELQRIAVVAYYFDGLKVEQIAEMMECSANTVKSRLNYARKYIKNRVEEKEKEEGYRLHVLGFPVLWYALKRIAEETTLTAYAAQKVYDEACSSVGLQATTISMSAGATAKGGNMNFIVKNVIVAGLGLTLSFVGAFGISQMPDSSLEITTVQQAQAILDGQVVDEAESDVNTDTNANTEAESVQDAGQGVAQDTAQDATQDTTQDVAEEAKEGEIQFDWSFDDWTYNGLHISEGIDAMARSVGLDPTLEQDDIEHAQFGKMWYGKLEKEIVLQEGKGRVTYREFINENGGNNSLDIHMNLGICDENGNIVDASDITGVPFCIGTMEEVEAVFHIQEIIDNGEIIRTSTNDMDFYQYEITSNVGKVIMEAWEDGGEETYQIYFKMDGQSYTVHISPWSSANGMYYTAKYSFRQL